MRDALVHVHDVRAAQQPRQHARADHVEGVAHRQTLESHAVLFRFRLERGGRPADDRHVVSALAQSDSGLKHLMHRAGVELVELQDLKDAHAPVISFPIRTTGANMRRALIVLSLLIATTAFSQTITFPTEPPGGGGGFIAMPTTPGKHPALVVIQEWWGVNDWVRQQAERFAKQGYVALAVDLYRGKVATTQEQAHELMRGMPHDRAMADLEAGFNYLASRKHVHPTPIPLLRR